MLFSFVWVIFWPYLFILTLFGERKRNNMKLGGWEGVEDLGRVGGVERIWEELGRG